MLRYHRQISFPEKYNQKLIELNNFFNKTKYFKYTEHANENFKIRFNYNDILQYLAKGVEFKIDNIFEYYVENDNIRKVCYKLDFDNKNDIILVLAKNKAIITVYLNNKGDNHITLNHNLYSTL